MNQEQLFFTSLQNLLKLAKNQGNCVSREQIEEGMKECSLDEGQIGLVIDYLTNHKIGIGEPVNLDDYLTETEMDYLEEYKKELALLPTVSEGQKEAITLSAMAGEADAQKKLVEIYLPEVIEIAKLYSGQGVLLEDLVGEGNVALMMGVTMLGALEHAQEAEGMLAKLIMDAMEAMINEDFEEVKKDQKIADKVNKVAEQAEELSGSLGRKVTPEELAEETGVSLASIVEAVKLSGNKIEWIDYQAE